jgi:hypothetical protein
MNILDFFLFLWVTFALLDPDPDPQFECGSETLVFGQNRYAEQKYRYNWYVL